MDKFIELDGWNIMQALADHFNVDRDKVSLIYEMVWEGSGEDRHQTLKVKAIIREV